MKLDLQFFGGRGAFSGGSEYTHEQHVRALETWTQGDYNSLKHSDILEDFIKKSQPVEVQSLSRGVSMSQEQLDNITVGDEVSFDGLTSWSSRVGIAQSFAKNNTTEEKPQKVVYRIKGGSDKAAKIGKLGGGRYDEGESIMSSTAKFVVDRKKKIDAFHTEVWLKHK